MTTDPNAYIEVLARLLCAADVHVHDGDHPTWQQLRVAQHGRGQDDYRKAATWLQPKLTVAAETRLSRAERRCDELRAESKRRSRTVLEYSEKIRALEREIDGLQAQLGAEILQADQADQADQPAAAPAAVPPADRAGLRERIAEALLDHLSRTADIRPGKTGQLAFMPEITDPERQRIADAVLAALPAELAGQAVAVDRGAGLLEAAALIEARQDRLDAEERAEFTHLDHETVLQGEAVRGMAKMLRRLAVETPGPETQGDVAELTALVRDFLDPNPCSYDHHGYCQAHAAGFGGEPLSCPHARARKLLAPAVEAEHQPADGTPQPDTQAAPPKEPHPTEADLRHALAVAAKFHGRDATVPVDPAASRTVEYRHTCHDQTSAPGPDYECQWCSTLPESLPAVVAEPGKEA